MRRDLGDFQTPPELVAAVLASLGLNGTRWTRVLEPTCGQGRFLEGLLAWTSAPLEVIGIEIQETHARAALSAVSGARNLASVIQANLFDLDLRRDLTWKTDGPLLVLGNPPWITCAELGRLGSVHQPTRTNPKLLRGIDALTGSSNFDVAEAIWLKLISELASERPTVALLCKSAVARAVLEFAHRSGLSIEQAWIHRIDARRWFGASVGACLLRVTLGEESRFQHVPIYADLSTRTVEAELGFVDGFLVSDQKSYRRVSFALGVNPLTWRQGVKHDAAPVMELFGDGVDQPYSNGLGEAVEVELEFVYPLMKSSDLRRHPSDRPRRALVVPQSMIGEDTRRLAETAPRLWSYLQGHAARFDARKSSIYRGQPPFALFGIGPYSFAPFKVAVSGLHRQPIFRAVVPSAGRPVLFDDTCYLLPCQSAVEAAVIAAIGNDPITLDAIRSSSFADAKRPLTKGLLQRLDFAAILRHADRRALIERARQPLVEDLAISDAEVEPEIERVRQLFGTKPTLKAVAGLAVT